MRARVLIALIAAAGIVGGACGKTSTPHAELVTAERGEVAVTVGGIGHVTTLAGAAQLEVPGGGASAGGGSNASAGGSSGSTSAPGAAGGGSTQASADAVFPQVSGHVSQLFVRPGEHVVAGQPIATLADDGATATGIVQARSDLGTARLELAQKRVQDPARGVPPTAAELQASRLAILAARANLHGVLGPPPPADVAAARLELAKARADLQTAQAGRPDAVAAAELGVATANQKLALLTGAPGPADVASGQLELAKATLDQETLLRPASAPSPEAVNAADLAIALAQQNLAAATTPAEVAAAQAGLAKAQSDREALVRAAPGPTEAAKAAGRLAVEAAQRKLDEILRAPAFAVSAARGEVAKAKADLAALRSTRGGAGRTALRAALTAARRKLAQLTGPPARDVITSARFDVRKARADLAILRQRGAPANTIDLAVARLKVDVGAQRLALANRLADRLTVRANASGTLTSVLTAQGAPIDAATPVARIQDLANLVVTLDLSEFDVGQTHVGALARIKADALGGKEFGGRVMDVGPSGVDTGGVVNFPAIVALNSGGRLRPGMSVRARIVVTSHPHVVRIPVSAVDQSGDHPTVSAKDRSGALTTRRVHLGLTGAEFVEVRSGLNAGERVVASGGSEP